MGNDGQGAVVLVSGGMDSAVLLHYVAAKLGRRPLHALSFNYSQRHYRELECAAWQAEAAGVAEHRVVDLSFFGDLLRDGSALIAGGDAVPDLKDLGKAELGQPPTYVPNRNMTLLSVAAAYGEARKICEIFYGAQALDEYGYWDCTTAFLERINLVLALNRKEPVRIHAPFITKKKVEIVRLGMDLGVDFAHTWSCYRGGEKACGTCPTCVERLNAFREVGEADPLPYEKQPGGCKK